MDVLLVVVVSFISSKLFFSYVCIRLYTLAAAQLDSTRLLVALLLLLLLLLLCLMMVTRPRPWKGSFDCKDKIRKRRRKSLSTEAPEIRRRVSLLSTHLRWRRRRRRRSARAEFFYSTTRTTTTTTTPRAMTSDTWSFDCWLYLC